MAPKIVTSKIWSKKKVALLILRTVFILCVRMLICTNMCVLCVYSGHTGVKRAPEL